MISWKNVFILLFIFFSMSGCLSLPENAGSDELMPETASQDVAPDNSGTDEFADFNDNAPSKDSQAQTQAETAPVESEDSAQVAQNDQAAQGSDEFSDFEKNESQPQTNAKDNTQGNDEFDLSSSDNNTDNNTDNSTAGDDLLFNSGTEDTAKSAAAPTEKKDVQPEAPPVQPEPPSGNVATTNVDELDPFSNPPSAESSAPVSQPVSNIQIKSIQYKANDSGGAILIQASGPISYRTRNNPDTDQVIVEIPGAELPNRLKRPFNMRDIKGIFGSLDPYQEKGSNVARFVVQLRNNASDPFITSEGNTLLIAADKNDVSLLKSSSSSVIVAKGDQSSNNADKILTSRTLQEFLTANSKFYGKKISIETNSMNVRDALRFVAEEGGVNMVLADNIKGNVSLKLRDIPWDQAFVVIMKAKDLGYVRQGNVLRVATMEDLQKEEEAAIKLTTDRIKVEPLAVKVFTVNYAKVEDLATRIKDFVSERGKVVGDPRTNTVVVTDVRQSLDRISQLIQNLDSQPPQVLIEGRIIEATDSFERQIGINWGFTGSPVKVGTSKQGDVNLKPSLTINPNPQTSAMANSLSFQMGTLDIFGQLSAQLALAENENKIKILASPRIVTLSNEKAQIKEVIKQPYAQRTIQNGVITESVQFQDINLGLEVTPQITSDASVIMKINVQRDLLGEAVNNVSSIEHREADTKVMVKNGQTSVIGGVYQNDSNIQSNGVPWLKDIPVLGTLFRYKDTKTRRTELMIFLTPRIVAAGSDSSEKANSSAQ